MKKHFNITGPCIPKKHYMVDLTGRLKQIRALVEDGAYFTINRARQYGKTTVLAALSQNLADCYFVISLDFQRLSQACFETEQSFCQAFAAIFFQEVVRVADTSLPDETLQNLAALKDTPSLHLLLLFEGLLSFCRRCPKPVVLLIDEVDSATNNQVFLDFLAQLRNSYLDRDLKELKTFWSVILAGVYDVRNLKRKVRPEEEHKQNSPWNVATDFTVDMSFFASEIAKMLEEYTADHRSEGEFIKMNSVELATLLYDYTSGYPFLVSRLCKWMEEQASPLWTKELFYQAVRSVLEEKNALFDSLFGKLSEYPELYSMLHWILFTGKSILYNPDDPAVDIATMLGFIKPLEGKIAIANRIFETRLYNYYLSASELQKQDIYKASLQDKNQFIQNGYLDMRRVLEKFVQHFHDLYSDQSETFLEEEGRKYFLLYLRPIINGSGNYYIEAQTRDMRRTDVIVDYHGIQYVIELKIWHGAEYHNRGEKQLLSYLDDYHTDTGYLISFCFNQKKQVGVHEIIYGQKKLIEAIV